MRNEHDIYVAKKLFDGNAIEPPIHGVYLVACRPDRGYKAIQFGDNLMGLTGKLKIREVIMNDAYGRGTYPLAFYEWKPDKDIYGRAV